MSKYYIATGLENIKTHHKVRDELASLGHAITYDWTTHGNVREEGIPRLKQVCVNDLKGVLEADFVVVILPGGKGTHTELGYAIGLNKNIYIYSEDPEVFLPTQKTCCFYHHENVQTFSSLDLLYSTLDSILQNV